MPTRDPGSAIVNQSSAASADMPTPPAAATTTMTHSISTHVRLPQTLSCPALREIDMSIIIEAFPHLIDHPRSTLVHVSLPSWPQLPFQVDVELNPASGDSTSQPAYPYDCS